ncbi:hypothetical protein CAL7716_057750 [Calothrix sp. PCC 7716]|nr:hypothetical protein CAL7716_057750 [Calothrix sp. PCC 7716]
MSKDRAISIRLYDDMLEALDKYASDRGKDRTQVIREAITRHLNLPEELVEEKLSIIGEQMNIVLEENQGFKKEFKVIHEKLSNESQKTNILEEELRELRFVVYELIKKK